MDASVRTDLGNAWDIGPVEGGPGPGTIASVEIIPATATLAASGTPVTLAYMALAHYRDGTTGSLNYGIWTVDTASEGGINVNTGVYTANGIAGGVVTVHYALDTTDTVAATATLTVQVLRTTYVGATPMSAAGDFGALVPSTTARASLVYPLDQSVMPQNVSPPDVQWQGGAAGDIYRVTLQKSHVTVTAYTQHTGAGYRYDWVPDTVAWRTLAESDPAENVRFTVDRWDGHTAYAGTPVNVRLARGSLAGAVYYWDLVAGRILRIHDDTAMSDNFMPHPPQRASDGSRCVACHAISRDGRYMAAEIWEGQGPSDVFDLTTDLTVDPAPTRFATSVASWVYASFNPDATRLIANRLGGLFLVDPSTGRTVTPAMGTLPPDTTAVQPSWSPDGHSIAYVANTVGPGPTSFTQGDLAILPVTGTDSFGSPSVIHHGNALSSDPPGGSSDAYPTWTPDSHWLAFQHGPYSESDNGADGVSPAMRFNAGMYIIAPTGGSPTRLTAASGTGAAADAFFPNFSPFVQGGEYWLLFFSRRDYGNAQAGTYGTGRRQLWVTAVDTTVTPGTDPSHPPYWLPGQIVTSENISGFWAPQPCRPNATGCEVSSECCSGVCAPNASGMLVCNPPPSTAPCRSEGQRCGGTSDCCAGLVCDGNVCLLPPG